MADRDEVPYVVVERNRGGGVGAFLLGALVGAGLALLFAPRSGQETQEEIRTRALRLKKAAQDRVREAQSSLEARLSAARESVHARVESVRDAVDSGKQAALEAREDLEKKLERSKAAYRAGIEAARQAAAQAGAEDTSGEAGEGAER
jgi:gas vesicle protein